MLEEQRKYINDINNQLKQQFQKETIIQNVEEMTNFIEYMKKKLTKAEQYTKDLEQYVIPHYITLMKESIEWVHSDKKITDEKKKELLEYVEKKNYKKLDEWYKDQFKEG